MLLLEKTFIHALSSVQTFDLELFQWNSKLEVNTPYSLIAFQNIPEKVLFNSSNKSSDCFFPVAFQKFTTIYKVKWLYWIHSERSSENINT